MNTTTETKPHNPPAFPIVLDEKMADRMGFFYDPGMTLRDWFAGQALAGVLASLGDEQNRKQTEKDGLDSVTAIANGAYLMADAMLERRCRDED